MNPDHPSDDIIIRDRTGRLGVRIDDATGLPISFHTWDGDTSESFPLALTAQLETGGDEQYRQPRGFEYANTQCLDDFVRVDTTPHYQNDGPSDRYTIKTKTGDWSVNWEYTFRQSHPRLGLNVLVTPPGGSASGILRDLHLTITFAPPQLSEWRLEAPGNHLRPGVTADSVQEPVAVSPAGGSKGSTGLIALHHADRRRVLVVWPMSRTEIGDHWLSSKDDKLRLELGTGLAGQPDANETLRYGSVAFDVLEGTWPEVRDQVPAWYVPLGISTPHDRADWIDAVSIFEVQIGRSVFRGGWEYAPYPTVRDAIQDLGRIKGLGFDCLQIMPRQPYPSYNVHDYADISTSYGDEADLRELVATCHDLGMRVILDVLLHGVIDQEVITGTADRVRSGPFFARLDEPMTTPFAAYSAGAEAMQIAWCRHILDFEPHWFNGSPQRHPLTEEHPEWFMRNSAGEIIGIYTRAFDVANVSWQDSFMDAAEDLLRRLDIDGFRFDAPTYNDLPNWSPATRHRASYSPLGCLELFERLRPRLKALKPDVMLYTEPSGVLFRQAMDLNYNYDEQWLIQAVLRPSNDGQHARLAVRHGRDLAAWFRDRNAILPLGARTAHHIDSHDTFWWPLPGHKWRREQYGANAARALLAVFALSGGAYMTFVGGERELEDDIRRVHRLRKTVPEIGKGIADYDALTVDHDAIYAVVRRDGHHASLLTVNLSDQPVETIGSLVTGILNPEVERYTIYDAWNDEAMIVGEGYASTRESLGRIELSFEPFQSRLLVIRPGRSL